MIEMPAESLAFTLCQTPVCYRLGDEASIVLVRTGGTTLIKGNALSTAASSEIFARSGTIAKVLVTVPRSALFSSGTAP